MSEWRGVVLGAGWTKLRISSAVSARGYGSFGSRKGFFQSDFDEVGVPHGTYQYIEQGRHEPKLGTIVRIAEALGVKPMDLLDVEGVEPLGKVPRGGARKKGAPA